MRVEEVARAEREIRAYAPEVDARDVVAIEATVRRLGADLSEWTKGAAQLSIAPIADAEEERASGGGVLGLRAADTGDLGAGILNIRRNP